MTTVSTTDPVILNRINNRAMELYSPTLITYTEVMQALDNHGGLNASDLGRILKCSRGTARDLLCALRALRVVRVEFGPGNQHRHMVNHEDLAILFDG